MFDIQEELKKLPLSPGVYLMKNGDGEIIYVGKAIRLRNRVRQYFQPNANEQIKVTQMRPQIKEFEYIVTDNEVEALILECNLIKQYLPKYNILLKDNKTYPYLKITINEPFPRLIVTRIKARDKAKYFGPYTSVGAMNETLQLIRQLWPLRNCRRNLPKDIGKERPCLQHHIGKCLAPCTGQITVEDYNKIVEEIIHFLNGGHEKLLQSFEKKMAEYAENMEFEKAADMRDRILAIRKVVEKQKINTGNQDQDIIAFARAHDEAMVQIFFIRGGKMTGREHFMLEGVQNSSRNEVMTAFIKRFYGETTYIPKELILETEIDDKDIIVEWLSGVKGQQVTITTPQKGEKKKLVEMAHKNALLTLEQFGENIKREKRRTTGAMEEISQALGLDGTIKRIEAYDISNTQGFESVGSMVVFEEGKPKRSDYRKFKIKEVTGPNDYAAMEEVIRRRFLRYIQETADQVEEKGKFNKKPDILFIDGGKGQVTAAENALAYVGLDIPVCGMVKDDNHRTRGLMYQNEEIHLKFTSEAFKLVTRIQDEVHRFAIEYHRKLRNQKQVHSILDDIEGIGPARRKALLKHFTEISNIQKATVEELAAVDAMNTGAAEKVYRFFHP